MLVPTEEVVTREELAVILGRKPVSLDIEQDAGRWVYQLDDTYRFFLYRD